MNPLRFLPLALLLLLQGPQTLRAGPAPARPIAVPELTVPEQLKVEGKLHGVIQDRLPIEVLIQFEAPRRQEIMQSNLPHAAKLHELEAHISEVRAKLLGRLAGPGFVLGQTYDVLNSLSATISTRAALKRVLSDPDVRFVTGTQEVEIQVTESLPLIRQPLALASGSTGAGSTVVVIDTGVSQVFYGAPSHPVTLALDMTGGGNPWDPTGHGTIIAQVINAVAPGAKIISLKTCSSPGCSTGMLSGTAVQAAFNWIFVNAKAYRIKAVNLSLASNSVYANECSTSMTSYVTDMATFDIVPVVASGNKGIKTGIADPACGRDTIAVGAAYDSAYGRSSYYPASCEDQSAPWKVACFSNSGNMLDIVAPGCRISLGAQSSDQSDLSVYNCGTSLAAPHVTGTIALMRSSAVNPDGDARSIMSALLSITPRVTDAANNLSRPALNVPAAVAAAVALPGAPGSARAAQTTANVIVPSITTLLLM